MVTSIHVTRILEKTAADFVYEHDTYLHDSLEFTDCSDYYPAQNLSASWDSFLTGQQHDSQTSCDNNSDRKYPIRIFSIQQEA
jgi:hypothetical protein